MATQYSFILVLKVIRVYILRPTRHRAVRLGPSQRGFISPVYKEKILISVTVIIIELSVIFNPLPSERVGYFFHLNTGINFSPNSPLFSCALEGGPITWVPSAETPLGFISFAHDLGVNHTAAFPDCQRASCLCEWRQADIKALEQSLSNLTARIPSPAIHLGNH